MLVELIQTGLPTLPGRTFYVITLQPTGPFVMLSLIQWLLPLVLNSGNSAEAQGFEPRLAFTKTVFKTAAFDRSAKPPLILI